MEPAELIFWLCAALVFYAYAGYALVLAVVAKLRERPVQRQAGHKPTVSFVTCAHNEADRVADRIVELAELLRASGVEGEVVLVADGCTDGTAERARQVATARVVELTERVGKAAALTAGAAQARNEILVFADSRQRWHPAAVTTLLENFADPTVGAVSGDLVLETEPGVMAGVGLYWRYEKWLRKKESRIHSTVGVTGAICAVRRALFPGVPAGTILDDVYWPLRVTMERYRVVHDKRAVAYDRLPERARDEFRRKVRTLAGNFQLVARLPRMLLPWRNPVWLQLVSHKLLRLAVPWALLAMLALSAVLPGLLYEALFGCQVGFYVLALAGNVRAVGSRLRLAAAAASVVVLNAAAWLAFWVWVTGRAGRSWGKVAYKAAPLGYEPVHN
jgi:cellulose synthase/poly-beta-1,6-N-acetylglucosamine synthase-like glycosyltransferase